MNLALRGKNGLLGRQRLSTNARSFYTKILLHLFDEWGSHLFNKVPLGLVAYLASWYAYDQCDQIVNYFSIFGHMQQWKLAQKCNKFAKVDSTFCQIRNKLSKICQWLANFCQSSKILPNLVVLSMTHDQGVVRSNPGTGYYWIEKNYFFDFTQIWCAKCKNLNQFKIAK